MHSTLYFLSSMLGNGKQATYTRQHNLNSLLQAVYRNRSPAFVKEFQSSSLEKPVYD